MGCCLSSSHDDSRSPDGPGAATDENQPEGAGTAAGAGVGADLAPPADDRQRQRLPVGSNRNNHDARAAPATSRIVIRSGRGNFPLNEHFNAPIRKHVWYSKRRTWTRSQLDQERREFFETRVTGRQEVWAALAAAISMTWTGDFDTAQSIVDAAGVTIPTGDLCQGCYDEQGVLYRLPQCIVSDPENVVPDELASTADDDYDTDNSRLSLDEASGDELITEDIERRRDEKGKTSERDLIRVKARLSDRGGPDIVVAVGRTQNVATIARKIHQEAGVAKNQRVRLVYLGRLLKEHINLVDQGWNPAHVINALVVSRQP